MSGIIGTSPNMKSGVVNKHPKGTQVLLSHQSPTSTSAVVFNNTIITDQFDSYELHFCGCYSASGDVAQTQIEFSYDNGSNWYGKISDGSFHDGQSGNTFVHLHHTGASNYGDATRWRLTDGIEGGDFGGSQGQAGYAGWCKIINLRGLTSHVSSPQQARVMYGSSFFAYPHSANASYGTYSHMYMPLVSGAVNHFRYKHSNGSNLGGEFKLYGISQ